MNKFEKIIILQEIIIEKQKKLLKEIKKEKSEKEVFCFWANSRKWDKVKAGRILG